MKQIITQQDAHGDYKFLCENPIERWRAETLFTKEPGTVDWLRATLKSGDCFYDIGANVGCYTLLAARLVGPTGRVVAFEPQPATLASLLKNVALNALSHVIVCAIALSEQNQLGWLEMSDLSAGSSHHQLSRDGRCLIYAAALDHVVLAMGLPTPDVIKVDVDGHEPQILKGMRRTLLSVRSVQIEAQPETMLALPTFFPGWTIRRHDTDQGSQKLLAGRAADQVAHNLVFTRAA